MKAERNGILRLRQAPWRGPVAAVLSYLLALLPTLAPPTYAQTQRRSGPAERASMDGSAAVQQIERGRSHIDRAQFDMEALLDELAYDAEEILRFVREEIAFEQYPGLLRGALGTLQSRAGNALDQAVLLATLLRDAGFDARIHRGRLSLEQADQVLAQMRPVPPFPEPADFAALEAALRGDDPPQAAPELPERGDRGWQPPSEEAIDHAVETLRSAIEAEGIQLGDLDAAARLRREARDYFWLEMRRTASGGWTAVHPVFAKAGDGPVDLSTSEVFTDEIPAKLQHRLRFEAFIEQKVGDELAVHPIMETWERPVANLLGRTFIFTNVPWGLDEETAREPWPWEDAFSETELFVPFFTAGLAPGARAFDLDGVPFSVDAMGMDTFGATALVREVASKFEHASGLLSGLRSQDPELLPDDLMALTAQWVEYTLIAPGGEERRYRRTILDRLGPAARARGDVNQLAPEDAYRSLLAFHTFRVAVGRTPPAFLLDQLLAELGRLIETDWGTATPDDADAPPVFASPEPFLFSVFDRSLPGQDQVLYRSGPGVVAQQSGLGPEGDLYFYGDLVRSPWRAFSLGAGSTPQPAPALVMRQGVWETATENYLLAARGHQDGERPTDPPVSGGPITLSAGDDVGGLAAPFSADARAVLARDLQHHAVVISGDPSLAELNPLSAWWRIDPRSGETLGIGLDGRGPVSVEWVLLGTLIGAVLAVVLDCYAHACDASSECEEKSQDPYCCRQRFARDRREDLMKSFPGTLLVKYLDANHALVGTKYYDPECLFERSPPPPPPTR